MRPSPRAALAEARRVLGSDGLLLEQDARLPSVATIVAGEPIAGSWWSHPAGKAIYRTLGTLASSDDVILVPLVYGKVTLVHRSMWIALLAVATSGHPWQTRGLRAPARRLLAHVRRVGRARSDRLPASLRLPARAVGDVVRDLERRLLVRAEQVHTEKGAHAKVLTTWERWGREEKVFETGAPAALAAALFEVVCHGWWVLRLGMPARMRWPLPWPQGAYLSPGRGRGRASSMGR